MDGSPLDIDALDIAALKALILDLLEQGVARDAEIAALRAQNRRLKGLNGPPDIKPSGMEKKPAAAPRRGGAPTSGGGARRKVALRLTKSAWSRQMRRKGRALRAMRIT